MHMAQQQKNSEFLLILAFFEQKNQNNTCFAQIFLSAATKFIKRVTNKHRKTQDRFILNQMFLKTIQYNMKQNNIK